MNVNHPQTRGMAFLFIIWQMVLAEDLAHLLLVFILNFGRQWGFNLANAIWFFCGIFLYF